MSCDYFRLCYIYLNGGFYIDADEYQGTECDHLFENDKLKIQPLCYDTASGEMIAPFMFLHNYSSNWIFYVNNNPIIAPARHPVIQLALSRATTILLSNKDKKCDIQSTTGPGNLSASLVKHYLELNDTNQNFSIINDWNSISISPWPLSYRNYERNWRLWKYS